MMHVMSSMTSSSFFQRFVASFTRAFAAASGEFFSTKGNTSHATSTFDINSQTPSDASRMNWSNSVSVYSIISGSGITPTDYATLSPIDLDMASPGTSSSWTQTLKGPIGSPFMSLKASTLPFCSIIRLYSSCSSGLWSHVSYST